MTQDAFYDHTNNNPFFPEIEEGIIEGWKQDQTFERSVEQRTGAEWVFYDGPPFANGLPHYGHLLTSYVKDVFARYHTMKGERVERRFGWDCHGLPAEMGAEKELGVSGRAAIEKFGIKQFNDHCRSSVMKYTDVWQDYIDRAGRWVDFDNDYKTMDTSYMESVIWAFNELYNKGLVYESHRVMPYSWAAQSPLSNFETRMDDSYREREDKAITVAFKLKDVPNWVKENFSDAKAVYVLAWTTTPWTLPSNLALAVGNGMNYDCAPISGRDGEYAIVATPELSKFDSLLNHSDGEEPAYVPCSIRGSDLVGLSYEPLFPYFAEKKNESENAFTIISGDFVEEGSGTGIVHLAPGFGEDDQRVCADVGIGVVCPVDEAGRYTNEVFDIDGDTPLSLKGLNVIADDRKSDDEPYNENQLKKNGLANLRIIQYLKSTGQLIKQEDYKHSYPHCWRTDEPLIYKAVPSWYVEVTKIKDRMVELNQNINWIPNHIKDGQFGKWLENARDWSISRNRYWGCPIPIWRTESGKIKSFGSIAELEAFFGQEVEDLHRPFIDTLTKKDEETGETWTRVTDVFDCWFESGSMPYAQVHYPFENKEHFEANFPADFIVEYVGQTRGWFYTLMVLSTALFDSEPFKNCICHGIILDAEGKKLSKRLRNYPDPNEMFDVNGSDAMRWRLISEPVMMGGNLLIAKDGSDIRDVVRLTIKPIWNAYHFFSLYANTDGIQANFITDSDNLMDRYILSKLKYAVQEIDTAMTKFLTPDACKAVEQFFETLNNWYIRRNRERFWRKADGNDGDKKAAYDTLYTCLMVMAQAAAPLLPLTLEAIYKGLKGEQSVHLCDFPNVSMISDEAQLLKDMDYVRHVCTAALAVRDNENIRIRQPLYALSIYSKPEAGLNIADFSDLIRDELNVKNVVFSTELDNVATLKLQINFPVAGKRLGKEMKTVAGAAKQGNWKEENGVVSAGDMALEEGEYSIQLEPKEAAGAQALSSNDAVVVLDLTITDELRHEGIARDVVRMVQQARKDADLLVSDRITLSVTAGAEVEKAVHAHTDYIKEQTLAVALAVQNVEALPHRTKADIQGESVEIGFNLVA